MYFVLSVYMCVIIKCSFQIKISHDYDQLNRYFKNLINAINIILKTCRRVHVIFSGTGSALNIILLIANLS